MIRQSYDRLISTMEFPILVRHLYIESGPRPPWFTLLTCTRWDNTEKNVTAVAFFPAQPRPDQRGKNTGQIRKVYVHEMVWFLVYRMDDTRSHLSAHNGILVCPVRDIWQFKVFAGKEVIALPATREEEGYCGSVSANGVPIECVGSGSGSIVSKKNLCQEYHADEDLCWYNNSNWNDNVVFFHQIYFNTNWETRQTKY